MTSRGCWLIQPATATTRNCNTWEKATYGASRAEALGGHERRDPASVQRRISPSDGVDRVLGQYGVESGGTDVAGPGRHETDHDGEDRVLSTCVSQRV